jgi:hypothetical protein
MNGEESSWLLFRCRLNTIRSRSLTSTQARRMWHTCMLHVHMTEKRTSEASNFRDAMRQHQLIDQIVQTSETFFR